MDDERQKREKMRVPRKDAILALHRKHPRWTAVEIARALGIEHSGFVTLTLRRNGREPALKFKRLQDWERQAVADAVVDGEPLKMLAGEFGTSMATISRVAKRAGVPRRSAKRPIKPANRQFNEER